MLLHTINQAALVKSTDNSGNSCNMRAKVTDQLNQYIAGADLAEVDAGLVIAYVSLPYRTEKRRFTG